MIRKISIGVDYKDAMHYTVGQSFGGMTIDTIYQLNPQHYQIWIKNDKSELSIWKEIVGMPCVIEMDLKAFG
jgi:hypothetical protein